MKRILPIVLGGAVLAIPALASAHFLMVAPTPWLQQDQRGDPQKLAPCGGTSANPGTPTGVITPVRGGDMLHIKLQETVFHPGHYRIALAVNGRSELPPDPVTKTRETEKGPWSVSAKIEKNPKRPILADGLFQHTTRPEPGSYWETDVKMPNINCATCTLQVIEWMGEHGHGNDGDYSYHHCAVLKITPNPDLPIDKAWSKFTP
jgi:hypothetical protein